MTFSAPLASSTSRQWTVHGSARRPARRSLGDASWTSAAPLPIRDTRPDGLPGRRPQPPTTIGAHRPQRRFAETPGRPALRARRTGSPAASLADRGNANKYVADATGTAARIELPGRSPTTYRR
jgi:hypothetical protein